MPVASLDIGSNSVKLLVVAIDEQGSLRPRFDATIVTRLAEGVQASGVLSEAAMSRTIAAIRDLLREAGVRRGVPLRAIVTAPGRAARNAGEFLARLAAETGVKADIVGGHAEAELCRLATRHAFPELDRFIMVDLGGASTELVLSRGDETPALVSLDVGVVRLTEGWLSQHDPATEDDLARARAVTHEAVEAVVDSFRDAEAPLILVSGTATSLASLHFDLDHFDAERVHRQRITADDLDRLCDRLAGMTVAERRQLPAIDPARADVILAGAVIVQALFEELERSHAFISDRGPRWGLAWAALQP
jgi:exopolyphosphatase/guanosine-5'-triphosphate,3'-diphosphate pyrophosphatase